MMPNVVNLGSLPFIHWFPDFGHINKPWLERVAGQGHNSMSSIVCISRKANIHLTSFNQYFSDPTVVLYVDIH